jgi:hypothetical protein
MKYTYSAPVGPAVHLSCQVIDIQSDWSHDGATAGLLCSSCATAWGFNAPEWQLLVFVCSVYSASPNNQPVLLVGPWGNGKKLAEPNTGGAEPVLLCHSAEQFWRWSSTVTFVLFQATRVKTTRHQRENENTGGSEYCELKPLAILVR